MKNGFWLMDILFQEINYLFIFLSYLAWTKANSSEFIFHLLNGSFFPQWYSAFWIRRFSICSPKLPIKQTPLQVGRERVNLFIKIYVMKRKFVTGKWNAKVFWLQPVRWSHMQSITRCLFLHFHHIYEWQNPEKFSLLHFVLHKIHEIGQV